MPDPVGPDGEPPLSPVLLGVAHGYAHRHVLLDVTLALAPGVVTGVIGENGSGKSTLLRLLAGVEDPDEGTVLAPAGSTGYLPQDSPAPLTWTLAELVDDALADLRAQQRRMGELEAAMGVADADLEPLLAEYGEVLSAFEARDGYAADARVDAAAQALGVGDLPRERTLATLSGGERSRWHLAALLAADPAVLLLDEPTNHLDPDAAAWLERDLLARRGTTVVVTHDRTFLDEVAAELLEVDADTHGVTRYPGGYGDYLRATAAERRQALAERAAWQEQLDRLRGEGDETARRVAHDRDRTDNDKVGYDAKAARVQSAVSGRVRAVAGKVRRLEADPAPLPPEPLRFTVPAATDAPEVPDGVLLAADGVAVPGRLAPVGLRLEAGGRLLVTGPNGAGKSTLLDVLAGVLTPAAGSVQRGGSLGLLRQDPEPHPAGRTVLRAFTADRGGPPEEEIARLLALGLLTPEQLAQPVAALSTGGRRRLDLARLLADPHDVLLLDEPTNHLAPRLVEELEHAVDAFPGAVVVVSHDRWFRRRWTGDELVLTPAR
ncbi:ABC-F family ATP-binding cassette domain-containing protein [Kineococcus rubinsiae]|uniref:ABC-F family ATP-binding cassette domain-containing protein n=1 Tax=Kineococcus rubinsiae TaxID=2609562 RepID=UPI00358DD0F6